MKQLVVSALLSFGILMIITSLAPRRAHAYDRMTGRMFAPRSPVLARHAMAASSQPLATQAAIEIMREGGTPSTQQSPWMLCLA